MHAYNRRELKRLFGLSSATMRLLEKSGFLDTQVRGRYEFTDLVLLRTVGALHAAKLSARTINRALRQLKPWLSETTLKGQISLRARNDRIEAQEGRSLWDPQSGQYVLPLEAEFTGSRILSMKIRSPARISDTSAHGHYLRGVDVEQDDLNAAMAAYRACLKGDCTHMQARINLGRLLHLEGEHREAESIYRRAQEPNAILLFNLGVLLEDLHREAEAMAAYREAIVHDPGMADAHFNLALLHERAGEAQAAFRHLLSYRRLRHLGTSLNQ
jgi:tetratricopeptide (TPR) repeat protein